MVRFPTPDENAGEGEIVPRFLNIPDNPGFRQALLGALSVLCFESVWYESGSMSPADAAQLAKEVFMSFGANPRIGEIVMGIYNTVTRTNMLVCDGAQYNRVDYPELYAITHSSLIDSPDLFRVPDMQGRVPVSVGAHTTGIPGYGRNASGGNRTQTLTVANLPPHTHTVDTAFPVAITLGELVPTTVLAPGGVAPTGSTGNGTAFDKMPPFRAVQFFVIAR